MSDRKGLVPRLFARVRALLSDDWYGAAGRRFRKTAATISDFAVEHKVCPADLANEGVELIRRKLHGSANVDLATAMSEFAKTEQTQIETELLRRSLETQVHKLEAEARLAHLKVLDAEVELLKKLKENGAILRKDGEGNYTVLPLPKYCDLEKLACKLVSDIPIPQESTEETLLGDDPTQGGGESTTL